MAKWRSWHICPLKCDSVIVIIVGIQLTIWRSIGHCAWLLLCWHFVLRHWMLLFVTMVTYWVISVHATTCSANKVLHLAFVAKIQLDCSYFANIRAVCVFVECCNDRWWWACPGGITQCRLDLSRLLVWARIQIQGSRSDHIIWFRSIPEKGKRVRQCPL